MALRQQAKLDTRERVLATAATMFTERGFSATTIRHLAEAGGVSVGTVMALGDKDQILVQVFDDLIEAAHRDRPVDLGGGSPCAERGLLLVRPFVQLFTARAELARTYASILVAGGHRSRVFTALADRLIAEFEAMFAAHGCLELATSRQRARALYFGYVGTLLVTAADPAADAAMLEQALAEAFATICDCGG